VSLSVLIVEDDPSLNETLQLYFADRSDSVMGVDSLAAAQRHIASAQPDIIMLDQHLPDGTGLQLLAALRQGDDFRGIVLMMTGVQDLDLAIQATKNGAFDFIYKPVRLDELDHLLRKATEHIRLLQRLDALKGEAGTTSVGNTLVGHSGAMLRVSKDIALVADSEARVLITGETGSGKERVARAIHEHSGRRGLFLAINCASIVDTLMESDLFGHEKGAFTGASARKPGKFELANEGTLFLDEVGEMNLALQAKLLRVLQEGTYERIGGTQVLRTTARIIAATNRDLPREVEQGRFREDLLYRLRMMEIHLPPLRERREDIEPLVRSLLSKVATSLHRPTPRVAAEAMTLLQSHNWPGNVRELENTLTQALLRARAPLITPAELPALLPCVAAEAHTAAVPETLATLDEVEAQHIRRVLVATGFHKGKSCHILGISRPALDRKISKYGLGRQARA
jgi:two-component system response regulator AtoC